MQPIIRIQTTLIFLRTTTNNERLILKQQYYHVNRFLSSTTTSCSRGLATLPPHTIVRFPSLSPTMTSGNLASWKVKVGDQIKPSTVLAEIETDKATVDFESQEDGYVAKLLIEGGTPGIPVGKPIAVFCENKEDIKTFATFSPEPETTKSTTSPPVQQPQTQITSQSAPPPPINATAKVTPTNNNTSDKTPTPTATPPSTPSATVNPSSSSTNATTAGTITTTTTIARKLSPLETILREERLAYQAKYGNTLLFR
jgi:pyruvate dehydrogenase E2 component (dihydrolipoamide acetyltransferase)